MVGEELGEDNIGLPLGGLGLGGTAAGASKDTDIFWGTLGLGASLISEESKRIAREVKSISDEDKPVIIITTTYATPGTHYVACGTEVYEWNSYPYPEVPGGLFDYDNYKFSSN